MTAPPLKDVRQIIWPIAPPIVVSRNVFLLVSLHRAGAITLHIYGDATLGPKA